jgi:hypothetical protein
MGQLPSTFDGDQLRADQFIDVVKMYFRVNEDVAGMNSPKRRIAIVLTLMEGPNVAGWKRDMGTWINSLDPADNIPAIWNQFLYKFSQQFQDSQAQPCARMKLQSLKMKNYDIDQYIAEFEQTARDVGYMQGNKETKEFFINGLPSQIFTDMAKPPMVYTYHDTKQKAIECTRVHQMIQARLQRNLTPQAPFRGSGFNRGGGRGYFNNFQQCPQRPFFQQQQQCMPWRGQNTQYNSSNAPRSMANQQVPMDLDRTRVQRGNWQGPSRGNIAQLNGQQRGGPRNTNNLCFQCGQPGHFTRNCPQ